MFKIIPAIDILDEKCVRLVKGNYADSKIYSADPLNMAEKWEKLGASRIHLVDLSGARSGQTVHKNTILEIAENINSEVEIGGGIRNIHDIEEYLTNEVQYVILGSIIFKDLELLKTSLAKYGPRIIAGVDLDNGKAKAQGWLEDTNTDGLELIMELEKMGVSSIVLTDIAKDGMLEGPNLELYRDVSAKTNIKIIASGGITKIEDIEKVKEIPGVIGCIIGKALYEDRISLTDALKLED
jgi:phosphoribosylformimino-5-aminoimidazole carboxamide ribotide isomerase